jgi:hypothetical protein
LARATLGSPGAGIGSVSQPLRIAVPQMTAAQALARSAKSAANLLCHSRAVSVIARCAAIRSSIARRL